MVATDYESGSSSSSSGSQNPESTSASQSSSSTSRVPTTIIVPIVIIAIALLVALWLCLRRVRGSDRVTPLYRPQEQEQFAEKPKLCEVALLSGDRSAIPVTFPEPWRRLRPLSIHRQSSQYLQVPEPSPYRDSRSSRSPSPVSTRSSSQHSRAASASSRDSLMSQMRVGVLVAMPSPPACGRKSPDDLAPMPDLCLGFADVHYSDEKAR